MSTTTPISRVKWQNDVVDEKDGAIVGKTSLCFNAVDRHFATEKGKHETIVTWEGNFWECTEDVHDYAEFTIEVLECVTRKIAHALRERITESSDRLLVLLPNVIQLPLTVLAAERIGVVPVVVNPVGLTIDRLASTLEETNPSLIVTLDGFFQGKELVETKTMLDEAVEKSAITSLKEVLVVGHVAGRPGIPPPTHEYPGRRPTYAITVPMTEGRDSEWSKVISAIDKDVGEKELVWKGLEETVIECPKWIDSTLTIASIPLRTLLEWTDKFASQLVAGPTLFLSTSNDQMPVLIGMLAALVAGKKVVFFEGRLDYPDPARPSFLIKKYEVETLVIDSLSPLDKEYTALVATPSLSTVIYAGQAGDKEHYPAARHLSLDLAY